MTPVSPEPPPSDVPGAPRPLTTGEVIDLIFRNPLLRYGLEEFRDMGRIDEILNIYPRVVTSHGRQETRYYLRCFKRGIEIQVYSDKKSNPEEIVRQLWLHKLQAEHHYPLDRIAVEHPITFGTVTADKSADIMVFQADLTTAKIVIEVKKPDRRDGLSQLKSYLNAEGSPIGVWSNGHERVILYRPYPREFDDTLTEVPSVDQEPADVLAARVTLADLHREFDFKRIIQTLQELVLAGAGVDEFNEIFKIIFAKLYDEIEAKGRANQVVSFRKSDDPDVTYERIDGLFRAAMQEWPGIFDDNEHIRLTPHHLQVVAGPVERIRLLGANMRVMDDAFEYLIPTVAKKKNGQFFTPRYVIDMCVKMLNPTRRETVLDPACGSAGFLLHVMEHVWPIVDDNGGARREERKHRYAGRYLWGIDFDERSAKVARALMLIAGDGRSHVFRANSLDPREWFLDQEGESLRNALRESNLLAHRPRANQVIRESEAWDFYQDMRFDVILTNPPFAGEIRDQQLLRRYGLATRALNRRGKGGPKEERDVLFIERCLQMLVSGGRIAIVLPQGKFNNATLGYIRDWIADRARLLAVVGLHPNTFKPHTGTKTSVLFLQKYTPEELNAIEQISVEAREQAPDYPALIDGLLAGDAEIEDTALPDEIAALLYEMFEAEVESEPEKPTEILEEVDLESSAEPTTLADVRERLDQEIATLADIERRLEEARSDRDRALQTEIRAQLREQRKRTAELDERAREMFRADRMRSTRGRLELLRADEDAMTTLTDRWVHASVAQRLNYPVFMATSERGGKASNGAYVYRRDGSGAYVTDSANNPLVDQDCVRYRPDDEPGIAEAFVAWGIEQGFPFLLGG